MISDNPMIKANATLITPIIPLSIMIGSHIPSAPNNPASSLFNNELVNVKPLPTQNHSSYNKKQSPIALHAYPMNFHRFPCQQK